MLKDTGTLWVIGSYHNIYRVGAILMDLGWWILNDIVWLKRNPMPQIKGVRFCSKTEGLLHRVIVSTSNPGDIVLDPFCAIRTVSTR